LPLPACIAIDGPAAVGKSTVGRIVARSLGYHFIDTGEMYRALTWLALHEGTAMDDVASLTRLTSEATMDLRSRPEAMRGSVLVNGRDITDAIQTPAVEASVSQVSRLPAVREAMVAKQRSMASQEKVVMAGRDIGTVVLPQAGLKVFLVAPLNERARRRHGEQQGKGTEANYEAILADLERRDRIDTGRPVSPLRPAADATVVDTQGLSPEQVAGVIVKLAKEVDCR
jgi:cytidylate kinase